MQKTKIEWANYVWNPIKGICPVGCWYCYARKICQRFQRPEEPYLALIDEIMARFPNKPSRIFVCSTFELFHPVADEWRDLIFNKIETCQRHIFIVLTKLPGRIDRPMPDNVWLGTTVENDEAIFRMEYLAEAKARIRFVSFEPLLDYVSLSHWPIRPEWVIIGRLTGHGKRHDPPKQQIEDIIEVARATGAKVFLKNNLQEIWGRPLIQEWPEIADAD